MDKRLSVLIPSTSQLEKKLQKAIRQQGNAEMAAETGRRVALIYHPPPPSLWRRVGAVLEQDSSRATLEALAWGVIGGTVASIGTNMIKHGLDYRQWVHFAPVPDIGEAQDYGLAVLTGILLGGSVAARKHVAKESWGMASAQVGAGAISNIIALREGQKYAGDPISDLNASDYYFAALYGGVGSPITKMAELTSGKLISNKRLSEAVADATVGSALTGVQYLSSKMYQGQTISFAGVAGNFAGGAIGAGGASLFPDFEFRLRGRAGVMADDFLVPAAGTYLGGGILPVKIEDWLGG